MVCVCVEVGFWCGVTRVLRNWEVCHRVLLGQEMLLGVFADAVLTPRKFQTEVLDLMC